MVVFSYNKKSRFNFELETTYEAGIVLVGSEVKSVLAKNVNLEQAFVLLKNFELFLINAHIATYEQGNSFKVDPWRTRKLLMHKNQICKLQLLVQQQKIQLIPLKLYRFKKKIKLEIAIGRVKKLHDKRETIKQRDLSRQIRTQGW